VRSAVPVERLLVLAFDARVTRRATRLARVIARTASKNLSQRPEIWSACTRRLRTAAFVHARFAFVLSRAGSVARARDRHVATALLFP
jgi:hypothetical protein